MLFVVIIQPEKIFQTFFFNLQKKAANAALDQKNIKLSY